VSAPSWQASRDGYEAPVSVHIGPPIVSTPDHNNHVPSATADVATTSREQDMATTMHDERPIMGAPIGNVSMDWFYQHKQEVDPGASLPSTSVGLSVSS
jgi:hypothetical protein